MRILILLGLIISSAVSRNLGDDCQLSSTVKSTKRILGQCTLLTECPQLIAGLKRGKYPQICSFRGLEAIVCCPVTPKVTETTTETIPKVEEQPENPDQAIPKVEEKPDRISKQKCVEYGKSVYKNETILTADGPRHAEVSTCIIDKFIEESLYAKEREFPHMALIGLGPKNNKQWVCSGSLISDKFVLTVAHCTTSRSDGEVKWVRLGDLDYESPNDDSMYLDLPILEIHRHAKYRPPVIYNDIALLELQQSVPFSEYIRPACLYTGNDPNLDNFIISGWALAAGDVDNRGHLRQNKHMRTVGVDLCNSHYQSLVGRRLENGIVDEMMVCTNEARNDACQISSGAALQTHSNDVYCMYDIVAISSFRKSMCGPTPIVHTRVAPYLNWIEAIVWPQVIHMM